VRIGGGRFLNQLRSPLSSSDSPLEQAGSNRQYRVRRPRFRERGSCRLSLPRRRRRRDETRYHDDGGGLPRDRWFESGFLQRRVRNGGDCREGFRHKDRPHDNIDDPPKALKTPRQSWVGEVDRIGRKYTQSLGLISTTWRSRCAPPWPPRTRPAHRSRTMIAGVQPRKGGIVFFNMLNMRCSFSWVGPDHE
jgi:hypothetical protein